MASIVSVTIGKNNNKALIENKHIYKVIHVPQKYFAHDATKVWKWRYI